MWQLIINGPGYFDTVYDLPEGLTHLGRADENDIVLSGDLVSRRHSRITVRGDSVTVEDLGSRNGCKINHQPIQGIAPIKAGDIVQVGENALAVHRPTRGETSQTDLLEAPGTGVRRVATSALPGPVLVTKNVRESVVMRVLDNFAPSSALSPFSDLTSDAGPSSPAAPEEPGASSDGPPPERPTRIAIQSLALMYRVAEKLAAALSLQEFLDDCATRIMTRVGATTAVILLRHESGTLVPATVRHAGSLSHGEVPVSDAIVEESIRQGAALAVGRAREDARFKSRESVMLYGASQVLCIPFGPAAEFDGVLYLNRTSETLEPLEDLLEVATAVSQLMFTGVQRFKGSQGRPDDLLRHSLERSVAPAVADRRLTESKAPGGKLYRLDDRTSTIVVAEVGDLSAQVHKLPPEVVLDLMAELRHRVAGIVFSFEGTVDAMLGHRIFVHFGVPYPKGDDAIRAVRAALALRDDWERLNNKREKSQRFPLKLGLHTGRTLSGFVGPESHLDFAAFGDSIDVAAKLCASAAPGQVLVSGKTLANIGARFDVHPLGERALGPDLRVAAFEVMCEDSAGNTSPSISRP